MEIVNKVVSSHIYLDDLMWKEKISIRDLKNTDSLILIFARHALEKEVNEWIIPGQFEVKIKEGVFIINRLNEDVMGQFIRIISAVWYDCLHAPYEKQVLWASDRINLVRKHGRLRKKLIPREFFNSFLKLTEVCRYFNLKGRYDEPFHGDWGQLERHTFAMKSWPVFNKKFSMCDFSDLHIKYLEKKNCDIQLVTKTKSHLCHIEALLWNGGGFFLLNLKQIMKDKERKIDCSDYKDITIEAFLNFVYLWPTGKVMDCFQHIEFKELYLLANQFNQEFLIEHTLSCIFDVAEYEDIENIKELNNLHFHPYLKRLIGHLEFLNKK